MALLLATNALYLLLIPTTSLGRLIKPVAVAVVASLAISIPIDSYFWQRPLWPELWGFYYNAILGRSSEWGTSPWWYYIVALQRLFLNPAVTALAGAACVLPATSRTARHLVIPNLLFVAIYSMQPHKEARFIFYVVPPLTAAAAQGASALFARVTGKDKQQTPAARAGVLLIALSVPLALFASLAMLLVSSLNYPGGEALAQLHGLVHTDASLSRAAVATHPVRAHVDVFSCMTGVTLFGQHPSRPTESRHVREDVKRSPSPPVILFDKTEDKSRLSEPAFWERFDWVLAEDEYGVVGGEWEIVGVVECFAGFELLRPGRFDTSDAEKGASTASARIKVLGKGQLIADWKKWTRGLTGGWWLGPRMRPCVKIMKKVQSGRGLVVE